MKTKKCERCGRELEQLTREETGATENLNELVPYWYCKKCNITYEE